MTTYRIYKPKLRAEFSYQCAYCQTREPEVGGCKSFHIDHYRPKKKFPDLINAYNNLIYACRDCNTYKQDYWPNFAELLRGYIIVNPREDHIETHIDTSKFIWRGKTSRGNWTVKKLRLDSTILSQRREDRIRIENKIQKLADVVEDAKINLEIAKQEQDWKKIEALNKFIMDETNNIDSFKRKIIGPMD